jgi:hypothetical protein
LDNFFDISLELNSILLEKLNFILENKNDLLMKCGSKKKNNFIKKDLQKFYLFLYKVI